MTHELQVKNENTVHCTCGKWEKAITYDMTEKTWLSAHKAHLRQVRANTTRKAKHQAYIDCGMVRVKGAMGGVYYE